MFLNLFNILLINILVVKNCIVSKKNRISILQLYNKQRFNLLLYYYHFAPLMVENVGQGTM